MPLHLCSFALDGTRTELTFAWIPPLVLVSIGLQGMSMINRTAFENELFSRLAKYTGARMGMRARGGEDLRQRTEDCW